MHANEESMKVTAEFFRADPKYAGHAFWALRFDDGKGVITLYIDDVDKQRFVDLVKEALKAD